MANYYRILSAYSDDGEGLSVPVPWNLDSVDDLSVVIVGDSGKPQEIDYWNWDSQLKQIEIPNSQNFKVWRAYVYRKEDAVALFQLIESHEINAQNILEQFQKISRILESLQENEKTFLSSPDYMGGLLPNASHRASKFVSFDEDGKPVCDIPTETFDDAVGFMEKAVGEAEEAFGEIVTAKTAEFNSNAASKKSEIDALVDTAEDYKTAAAESAGAASGSATAAAQSETNAASSASSAQASATAAAQSESNALASKNAAEAAAQIAQETDAGALMLSKLGAGQLWFAGGKLMVNSWANLPVSLPISICVEYDVDSWEGLGTGNQGLSFITASSVIWSDPAQLSGFTLRYNDSANRLEVILLNPGGASQSARGFSAYFNGGLSALPTGRHTIVFCASGEIIAGAPSEYAMYVDGQAVGVSAVYFSSMISADLTSTGSLSVCQKINYSSPNVGGVDIPIRLSRVRIFNFQMDADGAPYTVADYVSGKLVPPALYDPAAAQRALLALEDYTISRNATTRLVKDVSGNAYDATVVESGGSGGTAWTGTVKGSRDSAVAAFIDEIKTQFTQSQG